MNSSVHLGGSPLEEESRAADPRLAFAPKGTLPPKYMMSRRGGYEPEKVVVSKLNFSAVAGDQKQPVVVEIYFSEKNRARVAAEALRKLQAMGEPLGPQHLSVEHVKAAMQDAYQVHGLSAANAPHAATGPSENMSYLAPASKYEAADFLADTPEQQATVDGQRLEYLNAQAVTFLVDGIMSEKLLLQRYHRDMGGAIHVLRHPSRPAQALQKGVQLNFQRFDDIGRDSQQNKYTGLMGNRLTSNSAQQTKPLNPTWTDALTDTTTQSPQWGEINQADYLIRDARAQLQGK